MVRRSLFLPLGVLLLLIVLGSSTGCGDNKPATTPKVVDPDAQFKPKAAGKGG
jgi:hypothetical protein